MLIYDNFYSGDSVFDIDRDINELLEDEHLEFDENGILIGDLRITVHYQK